VSSVDLVSLTTYFIGKNKETFFILKKIDLKKR